MRGTVLRTAVALLISGSCLAAASQKPQPGQQGAAGVPIAPIQTPAAPSASLADTRATVPPDYVIGPDDVLQVVFRYDKDLNSEVTVRPDGMISLPMLNDVRAAGLTPDQLRGAVTDRAKRYIEDPVVTIIVRQINSRKVFITGEVLRPGAYPINQSMTVLQLIAMAGGLTEFAKAKDIVVMRPESGGVVRPAGQPVLFPFNYRDVVARRNLKQNIELKPGDTVIVP